MVNLVLEQVSVLSFLDRNRLANSISYVKISQYRFILDFTQSLYDISCI